MAESQSSGDIELGIGDVLDLGREWPVVLVHISGSDVQFTSLVVEEDGENSDWRLGFGAGERLLEPNIRLAASLSLEAVARRLAQTKSGNPHPRKKQIADELRVLEQESLGHLIIQQAGRTIT